MDEIPNLEGKFCEEILSCDEYNGDRYVGNFGFFLKPKNDRWHWVFFDYGPLFWKQLDEVPEFEITTSLHSRVFQIGERLNVVGKEIDRLEFIEVESIREVHFIFVKGVEIKLVHDDKVWHKQNLYHRQTKNDEWSKEIS